MENAKGRLLVNLANACLILREDELFAGLLGWDEMERAIIVLRDVPGEKNCHAGLLSDDHISAIQIQLQRKGLASIGAAVTLQAIVRIAHENPFHPIRDWLNGLAWDEEPRLDNWMRDYLGAADIPYVRKISRLFLIAMVARVMEPGCKSDHMIMLEHVQGAQKSTACKILAGGDRWFSDTLPPLGEHTDHVRLSMHLRGLWLAEFSDLAAMKRADVDELKRFLTVTTERFTAKHAKTETREPRQCLFVGTTNRMGDTLKDPTGARRFWPVVCGEISIEGLEARRADLFAEAVDAYRRGEPWWPTPEDEAELFQPEQEQRFEHDPWQKAVAIWLDNKPDYVIDDNQKPSRNLVWIADCAREALFVEISRQTPQISQRIGAIFTRLGWVRTTRNKHGIPWQRGPSATPEP
jgi:predicted P-loop ATPase